MSESKGYNGWTNYETWVVALWIDNEQGTYRQRCHMAQDIWDESEPDKYSTREQGATRELADALRSWVRDELCPDLGATLWADLLGSALDNVDWREIAENWLTDVDKEEEQEESEEEQEAEAE